MKEPESEDNTNEFSIHPDQLTGENERKICKHKRYAIIVRNYEQTIMKKSKIASEQNLTEEDILRTKLSKILLDFEREGVLFLAVNKLIDLFNSELKKAKKS